MLRLLVWLAFFFAAMLCPSLPTVAQAPVSQTAALMCAATTKATAADAALAQAIEQAFPKHATSSTDSDGCVYPFHLLTYQGANVLLTTTGEPGADCHACTATLSAYFFKTEGATLRLVAVHPNALETGAYGNPGEVKALRFGGDDGFTLEQTYGNNGFFQTFVSFYVFRGGKIVPIRDGSVLVGINNEGGETDRRRRSILRGHIDIDQQAGGVHVRYAGTLRGKPFNGAVEWQRVGNVLRLTGGAHVSAVLSRATE